MIEYGIFKISYFALASVSMFYLICLSVSRILLMKKHLKDLKHVTNLLEYTTKERNLLARGCQKEVCSRCKKIVFYDEDTCESFYADGSSADPISACHSCHNLFCEDCIKNTKGSKWHCKKCFHGKNPEGVWHHAEGAI